VEKKKEDWRMFTGSSRPESGRILQCEHSLTARRETEEKKKED
jgi:hypothetical protein